MTVVRYAGGLVLLGAAFVPIGVAAGAWRRRLLPDWTGSLARLSELVIALASVVVVTEVVGAVHLLTLWAVAPVMALAGVAGWWAARTSAHPVVAHHPDGPGQRGERAELPRSATAVSIVAVSVVIAGWATRTVDAVHHGMYTVDTLWYHLPFAARFVQQGTIVPLHYVDSDSVTVFFPASSELIHALGILFMGNDVLSPFINLAWMGLALLAGWCVGRPFGVAPVTMTGVAVLLATPGLVATQPGGAYDDVVGLALVLSAVALLVNGYSAGGSTRLNAQSIAALAAGLALGTKFTFVAPVAALTVGIAVLAQRSRRASEVGRWLLLVAITGSFWYLRNFFTVGNPIPSLHIGIGPITLPRTATTTRSSTVAQFLLNGSDWRQYFLPGLRLSFGPVWWAVLAMAVAGLVLGVVTGNGRMVRMLGWVGLATGAVFVVTPQYLTIFGAPVYFVDNVRYVDAALAIGLLFLPLAPVVQTGRRLWVVLGAYVGTIAITQLDGTIWPTPWLAKRFASPIRGVDSLVGLLVGVVVLAVWLGLWQRRRWQWSPSGRDLVAVGLVLAAAGFGVQQFYLSNRYTNGAPGIVSWAQRVTHVRIGLAGDFTQLQYGYYGADLNNYVQYIAEPGPHHGFAPITTCSAWRKAVNRGHYDYLITSNTNDRRRDLFDAPSSYTSWTGSDPARGPHSP